MWLYLLSYSLKTPRSSLASYSNYFVLLIKGKVNRAFHDQLLEGLHYCIRCRGKHCELVSPNTQRWVSACVRWIHTMLRSTFGSQKRFIAPIGSTEWLVLRDLSTVVIWCHSNHLQSSDFYLNSQWFNPLQTQFDDNLIDLNFGEASISNCSFDSCTTISSFDAFMEPDSFTLVTG